MVTKNHFLWDFSAWIISYAKPPKASWPCTMLFFWSFNSDESKMKLLEADHQMFFLLNQFSTSSIPKHEVCHVFIESMVLEDWSFYCLSFNPSIPRSYWKNLLSFDPPEVCFLWTLRWCCGSHYQGIIVGCSVGGDSASPRGLKVAGMTSLKFMPKIESSEICGQSDFPAILGSRSFPTIKTYLSSPEAPKTSKSGCGKARGLWHWAAYGLLHSAGVIFFCFLGWYLGEGLTPFIEIPAIVNNQ